MREYFVWLFKILTIVVLVLILPLVLAGVMAGVGTDSTIPSGRNLIAVIEVQGVIENSRDVIERLHKQINNPRVSGIVLAIDSPGGAVGPSQDIYNEVKRLKSRKPIVASMSSVAASGGLYAALGASKIYAQPGTITGSIGVILQIPNFKRVADTIGVEMVTIKSGKFKDVGNSFRDMTEDEKVFLQRTIAEAHEDFVVSVMTSRGLSREKVNAFADGRIILGSSAKELNLIDAHGSVYDAARGVFELLGTPLKEDEEPTLFYARGRFDEFRSLLHGALGLIRQVTPSQFELRYIMY